MSDDLTDGRIYVDYSHMNNAADDMVQQTKAIATTLASLDQELNALRSTWVGDDRDVYEEKQKAWTAAVEAMERLLTNNSHLLTEISGNYRYSSNSLSQMWSSVKIGG